MKMKWIIVSSVVLGLVAPKATSQSIDFYATRWSPLSDGELVLADLDHDGLTDLVGRGGVQLSLPDGTLGELIPAQLGARGLALRDLDADGELDTIAYNYVHLVGDQIVVHAGSGDGSFGPTVVVATLPSIESLGAGDFDGDGFGDLVLFTGTGAGVMKGLGGLAFGAFTPAPWGGFPQRVVVEDFDHDGLDDLVYVDTIQDTFEVLLGSAPAGLLPKQTLALPCDQSHQFGVGDFDEDGELDLVGGCGLQAGKPVFLGRGTGAFQQGPKLQGLEGMDQHFVGDQNGDGHLDLLVEQLPVSSALLGRALGQGDGTFVVDAPIVLSSETGALHFADLAGDGLPELVMSSAGDGTLVARGLAAGVYDLPAFSALASDLGAVALADVNGDGHLDLAYGGEVLSQVGLQLGDGQGGFTAAPPVALQGDIPTLLYAPLQIRLVDLLGSPALDMLVGTTSSGLFVLEGQGDGSFVQLQNVGSTDGRFDVGDLNGDGRLDLVVYRLGTIFPDIGRSLRVRWGLPSGLFSPFETIELPDYGDHAIGDVNADGYDDLVVGLDDQGVWVLQGQPAGLPTLMTVLPGAVGHDVLLDDFDQDGRLDLASSSTLPAAAVVSELRLGLGDGTFGSPTSLSPGLGHLSAGDVTGDGVPDLLGFRKRGLQLSVSDGQGGLQAATAWFAGPTVRAAAFGDLDEDGHLDAAFVSADGLTIQTNRRTRWDVVSGGAPGAAGVSTLNGAGSLESGTPVSLWLAGAAPLTPATLVLGASLLQVPFKGGLLVPFPDLLVPGLPTDAAGALSLDDAWPVGLPGGLEIGVQFWWPDAGAPVGLAGSPGLVATTP